MMRFGDFQAYCSTAAFALLCIAALSFPFSVAVCNVALGGCLILGLASGDYLRGARRLWSQERALCVVWLAYLSLFPIGLLWSLDVHRGVKIISHQWFWLLVPLAVELLMNAARRKLFLQVLGAGLVSHLLFCLAQYYGLVTLVNKPGSSQDDPTGFIGHTSFGLVYGIWATLLLFQSASLEGWQRWGVRLLALWAIGMVFLSAGRGGYLVVQVLLLITVWKLLRLHPLHKIGAAALLLLAMAAALSFGPGKARMLQTWHGIQAMEQGKFDAREERWSLWYAAIVGWREHMPMGTGTGGFHIAAQAVHEQHPGLMFGENSSPAHPHNMLLQTLNRWGPFGVLLLAAVYVIWIRRGWRGDWRLNPVGSLVTVSGIAMFVQGLSEPSFEEHFPGVLAAMLLGAGLAALHTGNDGSAPA